MQNTPSIDYTSGGGGVLLPVRPISELCVRLHPTRASMLPNNCTHSAFLKHHF